MASNRGLTQEVHWRGDDRNWRLPRRRCARNIMRFAAVLLISRLLCAQSGSDVQSLIDNRVETAKQAVGIVVGTIDKTGARIYSSGLTSPGERHKPDGQTLFEIGSITKVGGHGKDDHSWCYFLSPPKSRFQNPFFGFSTGLVESGWSEGGWPGNGVPSGAN